MVVSTLTKPEIERHIRNQLGVLIRLCTDYDIDIERLMREAIERCDPEPP